MLADPKRRLLLLRRLGLVDRQIGPAASVIALLAPGLTGRSRPPVISG